MTQPEHGKFARKHGPDPRPDPDVAAAVEAKAREGRISCAAAFEIAEDRGADPADVGLAIDCLEISIVACQLGLFGHSPRWRAVEPLAEVPPALAGAIRVALVDGRLPCAEAWRIAAAAGLPRIAVSSACEGLGIRICACQLGAF